MPTFIDLEEACRAACVDCAADWPLTEDRQRHYMVKGDPESRKFSCPAAPLRRLKRWERVPSTRDALYDDDVFLIAPVPDEESRKS